MDFRCYREGSEKCRQTVFVFAGSLNLFQHAAEFPFPPLLVINSSIPIIDKSLSFPPLQLFDPLHHSEPRNVVNTWPRGAGDRKGALLRCLCCCPRNLGLQRIIPSSVLSLTFSNAKQTLEKKVMLQLPDIEAVLHHVVSTHYRPSIDGMDPYEQSCRARLHIRIPTNHHGNGCLQDR